MLTSLGQACFYHVVSPAIGAMHSPAAGFIAASPHMDHDKVSLS